MDNEPKLSIQQLKVPNSNEKSKPKRGRTLNNGDDKETLYKISESGLEELSIVESEDFYGSETDNEAVRRYNEVIDQKNQ